MTNPDHPELGLGLPDFPEPEPAPLLAPAAEPPVAEPPVADAEPLLAPEEEREPDEELDSLVVDAAHPDQVAIRTRAAVLLRRIKRVTDDIAIQKKAKQREVQLVQRRHDASIATQEKGLAWYEEQLDFLRRIAVYPKGKKSIVTGAGTFGYADYKAKLVVADREQAVQWAKLHLADAITEKTIEDVRTEALAAYFAETGEEPGGCKYQSATDELKYSLVKEGDPNG